MPKRTFTLLEIQWPKDQSPETENERGKVEKKIVNQGKLLTSKRTHTLKRKYSDQKTKARDWKQEEEKLKSK